MKATKFIYIVSLMSGILFNACIKPLDDFELEEKDPKIVLNAILDPDSVFKVHISRSIGSLDKEELLFIDNALVNVYENNILAAILSEYDSNGYFFKTDFYPLEGKQYKIIVKADGYNSVETWVQIPQKTNISGIDTVTVRVVDDNDYSENQFQIKVRFIDQSDQKNYYMIELKTFRWEYYWDWEKDPYKPSDSVYVYENLYMQSKDPKIEISMNESYVASYDDYGTEDVYDKYGSAMIFSDKLINNASGTISVNISNYFGYYYGENSYNNTISQVDIIFSEISEDYFLYLKALSKYSNDPWANFFAERITLYSNVENGIGIIAAKSSNKYSIEINSPIKY